MNDRRVREAGRGPERVKMKVRTNDGPKPLYSLARRLYKSDLNALLEVFLNIAVVLVLVVSISGV